MIIKKDCGCQVQVKTTRGLSHVEVVKRIKTCDKHADNLLFNNEVKMSEESINYKGYTIEPCIRKERLVYRISNTKGKFLISRPNQVIGKFKYGKIGDMIRQIMTNRTGLFVVLDNKYQHVAITYQLDLAKSKQCIDDVISGSYRL